MEWGWLVPFARYTDFWRQARKLVDPVFRQGALVAYRPMIQMKTRTFLARLLASPGEWEAHIERFVVVSVRITNLPNHSSMFQPARRAGHGYNVWLRGQRAL